MSHAIDIRDVISKTTSEVGLDQLQQKGFTKVKVLDRAAIKRMIAEAVNKVLEERQQGLSENERAKVRAETQAEFDRKMAEFRESNSKAQAELTEQVETREGRIERLRAELQADREAIEAREEKLRAQIAEFESRASQMHAASVDLKAVETRTVELEQREAQLQEQLEAIREREVRVQVREEAATQGAADEEAMARVIREALASQQATAKSEDLTDLKATIENLAASVARGGGGGLSDIGAATDAASIEALVQRAGNDAVDAENNLTRVEVKEEKAKSVNANLEKLRNLKKGSG